MGYGKRDIARLGPDAQRQIIQELSGRGGDEAAREIRFVIPLNPVTKKNSQRIVKCGQYHKVLDLCGERARKACAQDELVS